MSILIVDDEERDRTWLKNLLVTNLGKDLSIVEGQDGNQAVELSQKHKPSLVFLDIKMGNLSGIKAAEQILKLLPETGVIMLTNFARRGFMCGNCGKSCHPMESLVMY